MSGSDHDAQTKIKEYKIPKVAVVIEYQEESKGSKNELAQMNMNC
jgi:hypothetical protein